MKAGGLKEVKCYLGAEPLAYLKGLCDIHGGTIADAVAFLCCAQSGWGRFASGSAPLSLAITPNRFGVVRGRALGDLFRLCRAATTRPAGGNVRGWRGGGRALRRLGA